MFEQLLLGLESVFAWQILLSMLGGLVAGIVLGAIPGLTASIGIALLIPLTYGLDPLFALAMMGGMHNGANFGGAIPAILLRIPGTPSAICTTFDGYPLSQQGKASYALKIGAVSSAVGGALSAVALMLLAPPLSELTLAFGPPELFWVNMFGMASVAVLLGDDPLKGLLAATFGLMVGMVGSDVTTGVQRFTLGYLELNEGFPLLVMMVGMYALPPSWEMIEAGFKENAKDISGSGKEGNNVHWPMREIVPAWIRSSIIGIVVGILPGVGGSAAGFIAYNEVRRSSKDPDSFGKGNPAGVASAESANSADNAASMVPALTLGVPGSGVAAIMLGALTIHGLQPGTDLFVENSRIVYGYMWAMLFTSIALSVFGGVIATRIFAKVILVPSVLLMPLIVGLTFIGAYTYQNSLFNVYLMFVFGIVGFLLWKLKFPIPPIVLGLVLGDPAEDSLRVSLLISQGDISILYTRPISIVVMCLVLLVLAYPLIGALRRRFAP